MNRLYCLNEYNRLIISVGVVGIEPTTPCSQSIIQYYHLNRNGGMKRGSCKDYKVYENYFKISFSQICGNEFDNNKHITP